MKSTVSSFVVSYIKQEDTFQKSYRSIHCIIKNHHACRKKQDSISCANSSYQTETTCLPLSFPMRLSSLAPVDAQKKTKTKQKPQNPKPMNFAPTPLQVENLLCRAITIARKHRNKKTEKSKLWFLVFIFSFSLFNKYGLFQISQIKMIVIFSTIWCLK